MLCTVVRYCFYSPKALEVTWVVWIYRFSIKIAVVSLKPLPSNAFLFQSRMSIAKTCGSLNCEICLLGCISRLPLSVAWYLHIAKVADVANSHSWSLYKGCCSMWTVTCSASGCTHGRQWQYPETCLRRCWDTIIDFPWLVHQITSVLICKPLLIRVVVLFYCRAA